MRRNLKPLLMACSMAAVLVACKKDASKTQVEEAVPESVKAQIKSLGFNTQDVQKTDEGWLVEGDIVLTAADLAGAPSSPELVYANEEHYRTNNLVNTSTYSTIEVRLNNTSS